MPRKEACMSLRKADSAKVYGTIHHGENVVIAQGTILRSEDESIQIGGRSMLLENSVMIGTQKHPLKVGRKTVFGHRCVGNMCIFGEGTIVAAGAKIPDGSVVVGRPGRVIRSLKQEDREMIARMRGGNISLPEDRVTVSKGPTKGEDEMGKLYPHVNKMPRDDETATVYDTAEITGDVVIGKHSLIGAGVRIIGDSHGPVIIGDHVHILENSVLHLLPDNQLIIGDHVTIGPACMIHGTTIGAGSVIESGAIVCDNSVLGENTLVCSGSLIKQRSVFLNDQILEGFPAKIVGKNEKPLRRPDWAFR